MNVVLERMHLVSSAFVGPGFALYFPARVLVEVQVVIFNAYRVACIHIYAISSLFILWKVDVKLLGLRMAFLQASVDGSQRTGRSNLCGV